MNEIRSKLIGPYIEDTYKTPVCLVYWYLFMLFLRRVKKVSCNEHEDSRYRHTATVHIVEHVGIIVAANVIPVLPTDKLVNGLCGNPAGSNAIHSNWVACLRAENNGCPHNFPVLEQTGLCPKGEVCCFLQPEFFAEAEPYHCTLRKRKRSVLEKYISHDHSHLN
ncbi:hypothetical protein pdam_00011000 [Pocillopora damicornis]|uniref:Uncharacterized protein n=1 Tax=Pocillopora damicornis TaxID=46731 RepID=A0A3M6U4A3_POCDA|nr:hypothetical protein pdam_00011000 [Pocillopora damicornis]